MQQPTSSAEAQAPQPRQKEAAVASSEALRGKSRSKTKQLLDLPRDEQEKILTLILKDAAQEKTEAETHRGKAEEIGDQLGSVMTHLEDADTAIYEANEAVFAAKDELVEISKIADRE